MFYFVISALSAKRRKERSQFLVEKAVVCSKLKLFFGGEGQGGYLSASAKEISTFHTSFGSAVEELPPSLQSGLTELQYNDMLAGENQEKNLI